MPELSNERVSDERLAGMLAGLEGVSPGPWDTVAGVVRSIDGNEAIPIFDSREPWKKHRRTSVVQRQAWRNLHHVARCDPDTMRSIITELLELRTSRAATVTDSMARALIEKYREIWPGAGWPSVDIAKELLVAALSEAGARP